jgi:hypothetical protein
MVYRPVRWKEQQIRLQIYLSQLKYTCERVFVVNFSFKILILNRYQILVTLIINYAKHPVFEQGEFVSPPEEQSSFVQIPVLVE